MIFKHSKRAVCSLMIFSLVWVFAPSEDLISQTRKITTYIEETQEERKSTRWTLTEWLRIKERMKMMDVWLAMFSGKKEQKFAPELLLDFSQATRTREFNFAAAGNDEVFTVADQKTNAGRLQLWLTNMVSSTTGLRTLNIDLGLEFSRYSSPWPKLEDSDGDAIAMPIALNNGVNARISTNQLDTMMANFRVFGRNIQDSSLILKYGSYEHNTGVTYELAETRKGTVAGAETYLYLLNWFGLEGEYLRFGNQKGAAGSQELNGLRTTYGAFLEFYVLRLGYRLEEESWQFQTNETPYESKWKGSSWFLRFNF